MKRIEVTDLSTDETTTYDYSRANWAKRWACMQAGSVVMWTPKELEMNPLFTPVIITSGRRWRIVKAI